jgi:S-adenosylmethionine:tRNA ribosyltransferase-isomerase
LLQKGDLLVFNDTKVINARLFGSKPSGGKVELLVERVLSGNQVAAHMRVSKKPEIGTTLTLECAHGHNDGLRATLLGRWPDESGTLFRFVLSNNAGDNPYTLMELHGHVPLPPYIEHADGADDERRYQTVFARVPGAVAATFDVTDAAAVEAGIAAIEAEHGPLHILVANAGITRDGRRWWMR